MEVKINKIVFLVIAFIPFIIYLNYSLHLPQVLDAATYEKMGFLQTIIATGIFYLPAILGIYAVIARSNFITILFGTSMLAIAILPTKELGFIEIVKLLIFSILLLWFMEWSCTYTKLARAKIWDKLGNYYLAGTSLLMPLISIVAVVVLLISKFISLFSLKLSESLELSSVYGVFISSCLVFGTIAVIKIWKK